jgi:hypothetical protein
VRRTATTTHISASAAGSSLQKSRETEPESTHLPIVKIADVGVIVVRQTLLAGRGAHCHDLAGRAQQCSASGREQPLGRSVPWLICLC